MESTPSREILDDRNTLPAAIVRTPFDPRDVASPSRF